MKDYEEIIYSESERTIGNYLSDPIQVGYGWNIFDFLLYKDSRGTRNIDNIFKSYNANQKTKINLALKDNIDKYSKEIKSKSKITFTISKPKQDNPSFVLKESINITVEDYEDLPLIPGTILYIAHENVNKPALYGTTNILKGINYKAFLSKYLERLVTDSNYIPVTKKHSTKFLGVLLEKFPQLTVWIWCRAIGEVIDITPFVESISTNTTMDNGTGSFNLTLAPISSEGVFNHKIKSVVEYVDGKKGYLSTTDIHRNNQNLSREISYFHSIISENDLIFIRYETLVNEVVRPVDNELGVDYKWTDKDPFGKERLNRKLEIQPTVNNRYEQSRSKDFKVNSNFLPGNIYDMIGLVDNNSISTSQGNIEISISGRDLTKVFIDDGCYFFPSDFAPGGIFANQDEIRYTERLDGKMINLVQTAVKSINYCMSFIFNSLSNIKICPNELFQYYTNKNTGYKSEISALRERGDKRGEVEVLKGKIYEDIELFYERSLQLKRKYYNPIEIYNRILSFLETVDNRKEIKISPGGDVGWAKGTNYQANKLPSLLKDSIIQDIQYPNSILNNIYEVVKKEKEIFETPIKKDLQPLDGIWSIIDLYIDQTEGTQLSVGNRRVLDANFGNENGSLINVIQRICQKPWVEFYGDTYGDRFSCIIRTPPFTKDAYKSLVELAIDIEPEEVISDNFSYDTQNAFSWYRLRPQWLASAFNDEIVSYFIKPVHFPEYADIWGEKPLEQVSNYYPNILAGNKEEKITSGNAIRQGMYDLKFLVDTTAYLPFTRKGQIQINGNRTIKKGTIVHHKATGEVFYVIGVSNNFSISTQSIERTTTLTVARGMVKKNIDWYFSIVETPIDDKLFSEDVKDYVSWVRRLYSGWKVNPTVFNKFIERRQWLDYFFTPDENSLIISPQNEITT